MITDRLGREILRGDLVYSKYRNAIFIVCSMVRRNIPTELIPEFDVAIMDLDVPPRSNVCIGRPRGIVVRSGCCGEWEVVGNVLQARS